MGVVRIILQVVAVNT